MAAALAVLITLTGCTAETESGKDASKQETLVTAVPVALGGFSPQKERDGYTLQWMQPVYDTLVLAAPDSTFKGMLAKEWKYSSDEKILSLTLEEGVKFDDGTAFNAEAAKANLEATRDGAGGVASNLSGIDDIKITGEFSLDLVLNAPDPSMIRSLSEVAGMMANPKKIGDPSLDTNPDGTGAYVLDTAATVIGSEFVYKKKAKYWNTALSLPFDKIVFKSMLDDTARLNALRSGGLSSTFLNANYIEEARKAGLTITPYDAPGVVGLFIWDREGAMVPALGEKKVRQAINMAIDSAALLKVTRLDLGKTTSQLFRPAWKSYDTAFEKKYPFDPSRAKELLKEAGYANGFTVDMGKVPDFPETDLIAQYLSDVGITVNWVTTSNPLADMQAGKTAMSFFRLQSSQERQIVNFFLKQNAPFNPLKSHSPELDKLIDVAESVTGDAARSDAFYDINKYLVDEAWFAPFYFLDGNYVSVPGVKLEPQTNYNVPYIYGFQQGK